jgi:hypothetical protein
MNKEAEGDLVSMIPVVSVRGGGCCCLPPWGTLAWLAWDVPGNPVRPGQLSRLAPTLTLPSSTSNNQSAATV